MAIFKGKKRAGILAGPPKERGIFGGAKQAKPKKRAKPRVRKKNKVVSEA